MKIVFFEDLPSKATSRIDGRATKLLLKSGKFILLRQVHFSMPIYLLSTYAITLGVFDKLVAKFSSLILVCFKENNKKH